MKVLCQHCKPYYDEGRTECPSCDYVFEEEEKMKEEKMKEEIKEEKKLTHEEIKEGMDDALQWICGVIEHCKWDTKEVAIQDLLDVLFDIRHNEED